MPAFLLPLLPHDLDCAAFSSPSSIPIQPSVSFSQCILVSTCFLFLPSPLVLVELLDVGSTVQVTRNACQVEFVPCRPRWRNEAGAPHGRQLATRAVAMVLHRILLSPTAIRDFCYFRGKIWQQDLVRCCCLRSRAPITLSTTKAMAEKPGHTQLHRLGDSPHNIPPAHVHIKREASAPQLEFFEFW